jgi:hypothetical protein
MNSPAAWYPQPDGQQRYWDGQQWTDHFAPGAPMTPPTTITNTVTIERSRPAYMAHGLWYWLLLGWWWGPTKWMGRVLLWLLFWPLGLWRSSVHHGDTRYAKMRRGTRR